MFQSLHDIKDQNLNLSIFLQFLLKKKMPSSILLYGTKYSGKMSFALALAKILNCKNYPQFCNQCSNCHKIQQLSPPNLFLVNSEPIILKIELLYSEFLQSKKIQTLQHLVFYIHDLFHRYYSNSFSIKKISKKIQTHIQDSIPQYQYFLAQFLQSPDPNPKNLKNLQKIIQLSQEIHQFLTPFLIPFNTIRNMIHKLHFTSHPQNHTVLIIKGIEQVRLDASNAFLKTLEEPPPSSTIILISENLNSVLPTIISRCSTFHFKPLSIQNKLSIIQNTLGFTLQNQKIDSHQPHQNLWDIISYSKDPSKPLVQKFFQIIHTYTHHSQIFQIVESITQKSITTPFLNHLLFSIHIAKKYKYSQYPLKKPHPIHSLPDFILDSFYSQAQSLMSKIKTLNLNPKLALSHYLIQIASQFKKNKPL